MDLQKASILRAQSALNMALTSDGGPNLARQFTQKAFEFLRKDAVPGQSTEALGDSGESELAAAYLRSIAQRSLLDSILPFAQAIPSTLTKVLVASGGVASVAAEGDPKAMIAIDLNLTDATATKAAGLVVVSNEMARSADPAVRRLFERELENRVTAAVNQALLSLLNVSQIADTGTAVGDLAAGIAAADASEAYVVGADPGTVARLALAAPEGRMNVRGGQFIRGVLVVPVDGLALTVIPASRLAIRDHGLRILNARHASVQMETSPGSGATSLVSLWQTNNTAIGFERSIVVMSDSDAIQVGSG